ncbi:MAG: hypothetical protein KJ561_00440 [Nanoarchaeota archaeon]|nr:hypothetical protein [Nanoarchaeota archaeon]
MKPKSKKAGMQAYVIGLLLFLILLITFSTIYYQIKGKIVEGSLREVRRANVNQHATAHIAGLDFSSTLAFPIIKKEVKKGDEMKESSRALVEDWSDLGNGKKELFSADTDKIVYCVPGHYLMFKDKSQKILPSDFLKYQETHTVSQVGAAGITGDSNSYINEYITGYSTNKELFEKEMKEVRDKLGTERITVLNEKDIGENAELIRYVINTQSDYTTVFVYMKKGYWMKWLTAIAGAGGGTAAAGVIGIIFVPLTAGGSLIISGIALGGGALGGIIGYGMGSDKSADWDTGIFLVPNKADLIKDLKCNVLPAKGETE